FVVLYEIIFRTTARAVRRCDPRRVLGAGLMRLLPERRIAEHANGVPSSNQTPHDAEHRRNVATPVPHREQKAPTLAHGAKVAPRVSGQANWRRRWPGRPGGSLRRAGAP